jgi:hypothetical protein
MQKICRKYAPDMHLICNMREYARICIGAYEFAFFAYICTPHFADVSTITVTVTDHRAESGTGMTVLDSVRVRVVGPRYSGSLPVAGYHHVSDAAALSHWHDAIIIRMVIVIDNPPWQSESMTRMIMMINLNKSCDHPSRPPTESLSHCHHDSLTRRIIIR